MIHTRLPLLTLTLAVLLGAVITPTPALAQTNPNPQLCILFIVDAMAVGTIGRTTSPWTSSYTDTMVNCKNNGVMFNESFVLAPAHPAENTNSGSIGYYPFGSSMPNPYAMSGTIFLGKVDYNTDLIQHGFTGANDTATVYNENVYDEISYGYDHQCNMSCISSLCGGCSGTGCFWDDPAINAVTDRAEYYVNNYWSTLRYLRVHYQGPGSGGYSYPPLWTNTDYRAYPNQVRRCDEELQELINYLNSTGRMNDTVIFVTGDHGQCDAGGHPWYNDQSDSTPLIIYGKGVKSGVTFDYCEHADITATICWLTGKSTPPYCEGRPLYEAFTGNDPPATVTRYIDRINTVLRDTYNDFYGIYGSLDSACQSLFDSIRPLVDLAQATAVHPPARFGQWHNSAFYSPAHNDINSFMLYQEQQYDSLYNCVYGPPDSQAPSVPGTPSIGTVTDSSVAMTWTASTDDNGVAGYRVFRNGASIGTVGSNAYTDSTIDCCTTYSYTVSAYDAASNESGQSGPGIATTPPPVQDEDLNDDGEVNEADLSLMTGNWLETTCGVTGDINSDGTVNLTDFSALSGMWAYVAPNPNLIVNPGFEDGMNNWDGPHGTAASRGSLDTTTGHNGSSASYKMVGGSGDAYLQQEPPLQAGTDYTLEAWVKSDSVADAGVVARYVELNPGTVIHWGNWVNGTSDWMVSGCDFTTTSGYVSGRLDLLWDHDTGTAWFDDISLTVDTGS